MPEISVILNNYNYGQYIGAAIRSVLSQDHTDFELIIVDDGSTDDSREIISSFSDPRIKKVFKANGGQLSAFNEGFKISSGDIVCFLDADDMYQPGYLSAVAGQFAGYPDCRCLLGKVEYFGHKTGFDDHVYADGLLGTNPFSVAARHVWTGVPTSACSIKRDALAKFLPYTEDEKYWKTRADDILIWGTDLAGANKYCFSFPTIKYRIHKHNLFFGQKAVDEEYYIKRKAAAERFCSFVIRKNGLNLTDMLKTEMKNGNLSQKEMLLSWLKVGKSAMLPFLQWIKCGLIIIFKFRT